MSKIQYFGIKFPFTTSDDVKYFVDLNTNVKDSVKSQLMHLIFTPKGQKIRDPYFGTDLIKYIFQPNDTDSWENIKKEITATVAAYIPDMQITDVNILKNEDDITDVYVRIDYTVIDGNLSKNDTLITKI